MCLVFAANRQPRLIDLEQAILEKLERNYQRSG